MIKIAEKLGFMKVPVVKICAKYTTIGEKHSPDSQEHSITKAFTGRAISFFFLKLNKNLIFPLNSRKSMV